MMPWIVLLTAVCLFLAFRCQPKLSITIICVWAPLQNYILPILLTTFHVYPDLVKALVEFKDVYLAVLIIRLLLRNHGRLHGWVIVWSFLGVGLIAVYTCIVLITPSETLSAVQIRDLVFPFEAIMAGYFIRLDNGELERLFVLLISLSVILSLFGIIDSLFINNSFYLKYANIAQYNYYIKGNARVIFSAGLDGSSQSRLFINRRLGSTYGDPLAFGMANGIIVVILVTYYSLVKRSKLLLAIAVVSTAVMLTFSRSAWLLVLISLLVVSLLRKKLGIAYCIMWVSVMALSFPNVREFLWNTATMNPNGNSEHIAGFLQFYQYIIDPAYFFGHGPQLIDWVTESGYMYIYYQLGIFGLILYIGLVLLTIRSLKRMEVQTPTEQALRLGLLGVMIATLVTTNFSQYMLTFNHYLVAWFLVGNLIHKSSQEEPKLKRVSPTQDIFGICHVREGVHYG